MGYLKRLKHIYEERPLGYFSILKKALNNTKSILDLGCGKNSPLASLDFKKKVGLDIHQPTIDEAKSKNTHDKYILGNVLNFSDFVDKGQFETIFANDLIEHFDKETSVNLVKKMIEFTGKSVVIFTPNGFVRQEPFDNNPFQEHKCGWDCNDFDSLGFDTTGVNGAKFLRGELAKPIIKPRFLGRLICNLSELLTYKSPRYSYHLLACYRK